MSQQQVRNLLVKNGGWMSARDMAKRIKVNECNIRRSLKQMEKHNEVFVSTGKVNKDGAKKCKRWMIR